jgi:hypothetical protein
MRQWSAASAPSSKANVTSGRNCRPASTGSFRPTPPIRGVDHKIAEAAGRVAEVRKAFRTAAEGNQIYRLAANWYGVGTSDVTPEQFATARWVFSTFSAVAVALAGSFAALVYYAGNRVPGSLSLLGRLAVKVAHARRAYYARRRKPLRVEVLGPERVVYRDGKEQVVLEKEVVRSIDQTVLIPRWGIRFPFLVNSLLKKTARDSATQPQDINGDDIASNVTPLKKVH